MAKAERELNRINMADICTGKTNLDDLDGLHFERTFLALLNVIQCQDKKKREKEIRRAKELIATSVESSPLSNPKRRKYDASASSTRLIMPDQPSLPSNPNLSGATEESTDEESTKHLLSDFLVDTMRIVKSDIRQLHWVQSQCTVEMSKRYCLQY